MKGIVMGRTLSTAKWLVNILLVVMVLGAAVFAIRVAWAGIQGKPQVVMLPVAAGPDVPEVEAQAVTTAEERTGEPDEGLRGTRSSIEHEQLGVGQVIGIDFEAWFTVLPFSRAGLLYNLGLAAAAIPAFLLVFLLRGIIVSAAGGEPFASANVLRVQAIGLLTILTELARGLGVLAIEAYLQRTSTAPDLVLLVDGGWNVAVIILGVVILALAEVFRYGLELQADADLTV